MNALMQRDRLEKVLWDVSLALKHDDGTLLHEAGGGRVAKPSCAPQNADAAFWRFRWR